MKKALKQILNAFDKLADAGHDELMDTDVREQLADAVQRMLVEPEPGYQLPETFGMLTPEGNAKVRAALERFFAHPEVAAAKALPTPKERLAAFQDVDVESADGNTYDDFFGYDNSFE